jgi:tetratricopeptide (TPR) repeat protein
MRRHDYEKEAALRDRARAEPRRTQSHTELAAWLTRAGRLAQAREALQAGLASAERPARIHHLLGLILAGAGEFDAAVRHLERAVEHEPTRFQFMRDLALAQGAAGRTIESVELLRQAVALGGDGAAEVAWLLRVGERALAESGNKTQRHPPPVARRAAVVERIVARDPEVAEAIVARQAQVRAEDHETLRAARRALASLLAAHPAYADLHFGLSLVAEQLGELDRAIEAAEKALKINPSYVAACILAGRLYRKSGKRERAAQHWRRAGELRPRWVDVHLRLGHVLREDGRREEAAEAYHRALGIDAKCLEAKEGLALLDAAPAGTGGGQ